jgi:hypothetical protein
LGTGTISIVLLCFVLAASISIASAYDIDGEEFTNRKLITIDNTGNANTLTNYQLKITVNYEPEMRPGFDDLRFTDSGGNVLNYWVEDSIPSTSATVWVRVNSIPGGETTAMWMYYGNPSASSLSDGDATFDIFEDFDVDDGEWSEYDPNAKIKLDYTTDHRLEFDNWIRTDPGYVYKSCSAQNFVEEYEICITSYWGNANPIGPGFSDTRGTKSQWQNGVGTEFYAGFGDIRSYIMAFVDGNKVWGLSGERPPHPNSIDVTTNTIYYVRLEKFEDRIKLSIFSDPARTAHIAESPKEVTADNLADKNFDYYYLVTGHTHLPPDNPEWTSGWMDNFRVRKYAEPEPTVEVGSDDAVPQIDSVEILNVDDVPTNTFTPGDTVKVRATISNPSQYRDYSVSISMNIDEDTDGSNGAIYDSHLTGDDWDTNLHTGEQDSYTWSWVVPSQTEAEKTYHVAVGIHDQTNYYDICYDYPGYIWSFDALVRDIVLSLDPSKIIEGESVTITGHITPKMNNLPVELFWTDYDRHEDFSWKKIDTCYTNYNGEFSYSYTPSSGKYEIYAHCGSASDTFAFLFVYAEQPIVTEYLPSKHGFNFKNPPIFDFPDWVPDFVTEGGYCFGMSCASLNYYENSLLSLSKPGSDCNPPGQTLPPFPPCLETLFIDYYQLTQFDITNPLNVIALYIYLWNMDETARKVQNIAQLELLKLLLPNSPQPLLMPGHCVVAYKIEEYGDNVDIYVYDPNYPKEDYEHIALTREDIGYSMEYHGKHVFQVYLDFTVIDDILDIHIGCPVDLIVTDPEGLTINKQSTEITDAIYTETDINGDGDLDDIILIPNRKTGDYQITVTPEPDAEDTDTYTLEVTIDDTTIVLAEDVPISEIPDQPYVIESTEEGIFQKIEDTTTPTIESVTLDAYTTIPDATIHVTVEAIDNVGVTSVTANGAALVETGSTWEGDITAPSDTGDYTLTIIAEDAAENVAETAVDYSVVIPTGGLGMAILPKISSAPAGSTLPLDIKIVSTENFDDILHVYLSTDGIPPAYQADLSWFNWTDTTVQIPAGQEIVLPVEVDIPDGIAGYKSFGVKAESTKWSSDAQDYGAVLVT